MRLGLYNAILHDRPLADALTVIGDLGLTGIELNSGGFLPATHIPTFDDILVSDTARDDFLGIFEGTGVQIAGLNANGNPLHPNPVIGEKHAEDVRRSIRLAERLGQHRLVTMSGLPAGEPGGIRPNWIVNAWNSAALDVLDYQWDIAARLLARDRPSRRGPRGEGRAGASPAEHRLQLRRRAQAHRTDGGNARRRGARRIAPVLAAMDPVAVVRHLGELVFQAAAKDVRINPEWVALNGVLDNSFRRLSPEEPRVNLGGDEWANEWPKNSAWDFVALGKGHDVEFWTEFPVPSTRSTPTSTSTSSTKMSSSAASRASRWRPTF